MFVSLSLQFYNEEEEEEEDGEEEDEFFDPDEEPDVDIKFIIREELKKGRKIINGTRRCKLDPGN